ncbi:hypothetical protein [Synechococcus sp. RSCCF101]|uniref:hypothetical protein n=1 Tax=Synechococcus sp. RSCCF101 TaxID=2511069 RepID=UPI00177C3A54|nr:hypothetical protein [Synechococcus sp. RSCCF101]
MPRRRRTRPTTPASGAAEASPGTPENGGLADRYYAMAEAMNTRGAMELAVPFYRQALTLLLAERDQLKAQLGGAAPTEASALGSSGDLQGLLEAALEAERLSEPERQGPGGADSGADSEPGEAFNEDTDPAETASEAGRLSADELLEEVQELRERLTPENAETVLSVVEELRGQLEADQPWPAEALALEGKAQLMLGRLVPALELLEGALALDPELLEAAVNAGAAELSLKRPGAALQRLRRAYAAQYETADERLRSALLRNLATAEVRAGDPRTALKLRHQLLQHDPQVLPRESWLEFARKGVERGHNEEAAQLLSHLADEHGPCRDLLTLLASAHEQRGDYQGAAQAYREMLQIGLP